MKLLILLLLPLLGLCQFPMIEEFNSLNGSSDWVGTGTSGIQNYGGTENYATFNSGSSAYPNNSTITITSPTLNLTNCPGNVDVSFPLTGVVENNKDYMYFEYYNSGIWTILATFTGVKNSTYTYSVSNTTTQFRFRLVTDCSVNGYKGPYNPCTITYASTCTPTVGNCLGSINLYYYDIKNFSIACNILPIELIYFKGRLNDNNINLQWRTLTETNNDYFEVQKHNITEFEYIGKIYGAGNSVIPKDYIYIDYNPNKGENYYRLKQVDYDGKYSYSKIVLITVIDYNKIKSIYDILGKEYNTDLSMLPTGLYFIIYTDNTIKKFNKE